MVALDFKKLPLMSPQGVGVQDEKKRKQDVLALALADDLYSQDSREALKYSFEKQWFVSIAFFMGYQHFIWDEIAGQLREPRQPSYRMNITANKIFPYVLRSIALMTQTKIPWHTVANSTDREDIDAARVGDYVLDHFAKILDLDEKRMDAEYWAQTCGTVFLKTVWDPEAGEKSRIWLDPASKMPYPTEVVEATPGLQKQLEEQHSYQDIAEGSPTVEVVNPFRMFVDPYNSDFRSLRWIMEVTEKPISYYQQRFPQFADRIKFSKPNKRAQSYERRLNHLNGIFGISGSVEMQSREETAEDKELWLAPGVYDGPDGTKVEYPYGRRIHIAGDVVLFDGDNPYKKMGFPDHGFPYEVFHYSKVPGRFWGSSHVEHLIPQQRLYNYVRSKVAEGFRMMGAKKWLSPRECNIGAQTLTSGIEVIEYDVTNTGGAAPSQLQPAGPAPEFMDIQNRCDSDMQQISAQPEAVQGEAPGSVRSGIGIRALQERALLMMSPLIRAREIAWGKIGGKLLQIIGENLTEETLIKIYGRDRAYQVRRFVGADLRGNYDVMVPNGSMRPEGKAETAELLMALTESGVLNPAGNPKDRLAILRMLRFSEEEEYFRAEEGDRYVANKENDMMTDQNNPQFPPINEFDDDEVHYEEHKKIQTSDIYSNLPDKMKAGFDWHQRQHSQRLQQKQQAMMQQAESLKGTPGQKGQPGKAKTGSLSGAG